MSQLTIDHLRREHLELRKVMARFESLLSDLDADPRWTSERCSSLETIRRYFCGPLVNLIRKKDEILYPALGGLFSLHEGPLAILQEEHKELLFQFGEVCRRGASLAAAANQGENLQALAASGRKGLELLRNHLYKEEVVLFPMVARYLTAERDAELFERMNVKN